MLQSYHSALALPDFQQERKFAGFHHHRASRTCHVLVGGGLALVVVAYVL
jgi:hypothetical protein